jgi:hypothetical protein
MQVLCCITREREIILETLVHGMLTVAHIVVSHSDNRNNYLCSSLKHYLFHLMSFINVEPVMYDIKNSQLRTMWADMRVHSV